MLNIPSNLLTYRKLKTGKSLKFYDTTIFIYDSLDFGCRKYLHF